jgi:Dolichyl-phosphate-mannose-protein mannosyltransferase
VLSACRARLDVVAPLLVGLLAVAVRLPAVWSRPLWEDEVASARIVVEPTLLGMLHGVTKTESTPPFWYFVAWLAHRAGVSIVDLRLLSVLAGGALAALVVATARRFMSLLLSTTAGATTALGAEFVGHGHELRAYELLALLSVVLALLLLREIDHPSFGTEVAIAVCVALGGLTHFFFAFSVVAVLAWLLVDDEVRTIRKRAAVAVLAGGSVAAAWAPLLFLQYHTSRFWWVGPFRLRTVVAVPLRLFTYADEQLPLGLLLSSVTVLGVAFGCVRLAKRSAGGRVVAALAVGPIVEAGVVWGAGMPIFDLRNLIGVGAFVAIAAFAAVDALPDRAGRLVALGLSGGLALSFAVSRGGVPPYDRMARALVERGWTASSQIAVFGDPERYAGPLGWYLPGRPRLRAYPVGERARSTVFVVRHGGSVLVVPPGAPISRGPALRRATLLAEPVRGAALRVTAAKRADRVRRAA